MRFRKGLRKEMTLIKQSWERRAGRRVGRGFPDTGFPRAEAGEVKDGGALGRLQVLRGGKDMEVAVRVEAGRPAEAGLERP